MTTQEEDIIIRERDQWFRKNIKWLEHEVKYKICKTTGPMSSYWSDLLQIATLQFLNKPLPQQKQMIDDNMAGWYILVTAGRHIQSSTSPFYNQVRKLKLSTRSGAMPERSNEDEDELLENKSWYQCFQREIEKMNFYHRQLLIDKFHDGLTYDEMHQKYNITKISLTNDVRAALKMIRCRCNDDCK